MMATQVEARVLTAPVNLGLETRIEFRRAAVDLIETMTQPGGRLVIDLTPTRTVDSAGLGVLMLVQRHAAERRLRVVLRRPNDELRFLLALTKLDDLFDLDAA
ncbi:MAG TPA: STAS domain-containing protein [Gemmatimonadales bacterium]